jgi:hypothetical protein
MHPGVALAVVAALAGAPSPAAPASADEPPGDPGAGAEGGSQPQPPPPAPEPEAPARPAGRAAGEMARERGETWFLLPVVFWLPETRLGLGATGGLHLDRTGSARPTSLFGAVVYTIDNQGAIDAAIDAYARGGALLSARARLVYFPDVTYGIGPSTPSSAREPFTRRGGELVATGEVPIPGIPGLRAGPRLELRVEEILDRVPGGTLATGSVPGASGFSAIALGGSVTYDTRDGTFWSRRGTYAQGWYDYAPAALGRNDGFGRAVVDLREFLPLGGDRVLGLQAYAEGSHGVTPFTLLAKLGSTRFLRGIREGRYRDRLDWATQAELRIPVRGRVSATAFAAIGNVAPSVQALTLRDPKLAGGVGLRYRLTSAGANIRVDGAISRFGPELYVLVLEAF